jgi:hypothetical protein
VDWYILEKVVEKNNPYPSADIAVYSCYSLMDNIASRYNNSSNLQDDVLEMSNT